MAHTSGRKGGRALSRLTVTAIVAALTSITVGTAVAAGPASLPARTAAKAAGKAVAAQPKAVPRNGVTALRSVAEPTAEAPLYKLFAADNAGYLYAYKPNGTGNFEDAEYVINGWQYMTAAIQVDHDRNGVSDGLYTRETDGSLWFNDKDLNEKRIGGGWDIYDRLLSVGDVGGAGESDILARDKAGVLWVYLAHPDGTLSDRFRVGRGWDQYTDIVGKGDLNGDGKADMLAKDRNGDLWFYKGTGDYKDPFASRVKVGGGWNTYNMLVATGDVDRDGRSDLLARDKSGVLWLYRGNGNQTDPFENRTKIGGGWDQYVTMY
ncbi:VCBS repeat-containing protein [Streptomyces sp. NPDC049555]|uniref:FG-GAP repeat domain-containing protein n=1 Tax=unclassified Streptomyces TaxID=2593676 RepID=UPI00342B180F